MRVGGLLLLASSAILAGCSTPHEPPIRLGEGRMQWAIAIHGGAGTIDKNEFAEVRQEYLDALSAALEVGRNVLDEGGTSLDAVQQVIVTLENDPHFNAGKGAVFNAVGGHELDASIMDGDSLAAGAVAAVSTVKNPIVLARRVMERTRHVLLIGAGAERFADEMQVDRVANASFDTERRRKAWERKQAAEARGTVGCVALDRDGNLAAGTSTGGLTGKRFGRVGDSPVIGAGTYADNESCAVSCTGIGEEFMRHAVAYQVSAQMKLGGLELEAAARRVIDEVLRPGDGGLIGVDHRGNIALAFNTPGMFRGAADSSGRFEVAIWED